MREGEFYKLKLRPGSIIEVTYRSNWRGGDGRPFNHKKGKTLIGKFEYIERKGIKLSNKEFPINYKAIREVVVL